MRKHSKEMWHIPKRGSIHQIIGALNILSKYKLEGKKWPGLTRKKFDQKFAMWGFTERGRSLSRTASETLEALLKYLGLIYIRPYDRVLIITQAGKDLIKEYPLSEPKKKKRKLDETISEMGEITSNVLKWQMLKLVITNPIISSYCEGIRVAPFRETLKLLIDDDIRYLTAEEVGYILFFMRHAKERSHIKRKIIEFRNLSDNEKKKIIEEYIETPEGNLTLKQAPTTNYWFQLCKNTGLCETFDSSIRIIPSKLQEVRKDLARFSDEIPPFDRMDLWTAYIGEPRRIKYPMEVTFEFSNVDRKGVLISIKQNGKIMELEGVGVNLIADGLKHLTVPLFLDEQYQIEVKSVTNMRTLYERDLTITEHMRKVQIELPKLPIEEELSKETVIKNIKQMIIEEKMVDDEYYERIKNVAVPLGLVKSYAEIERFIERNRIMLRGGRLEFLVYCFLKALKNDGLISKLSEWRGQTKNGIYLPAPAGKLPDMDFEIDNLVIGLEVTAATGRTQWKTEAESVTDHLVKFRKTIEAKSKKRVIGLFVAPKIEEFMEAICKYVGEKEQTLILCYPILNLLSTLDQNTSEQIIMKFRNILTSFESKTKPAKVS
ncbi:MAG: AlwI family type II restriction endonuclease [Candidatus Bathyarchaeia archaeon]